LTFIKAELLALNDINAGTWVDLLELSNISINTKLPLNVCSENYNIDKNIKCFIDTTGIVKLISEAVIPKDTRIYINGFY
jgi:hypothetical protein